MRPSLQHRLGLLRSLAIYYGRPWKLRRMQKQYARWVQPGGLCFDIGAHVGNRSFAWSRMGARVVAVEPQPLLCQWLRWQFGRNSQVTILESAIGADTTPLTLEISPTNPTVSSVDRDWIDQVRKAESWEWVTYTDSVTVAQTTLDALCEAHGIPDFCKIDVEGHEAAVLRGCSTALPALSFEVVGAAPEAAHACLAQLDALGSYRYAVSHGESQQLGAWVNSAEIHAWIDTLDIEAPSADVFAELVTFS